MKRVLTLLILTLSYLNGFSQTLTYGASAGLNYSSFVINNFGDNTHQKYKLGFQFNVVISYHINDIFGLSIEPGFTNRGTILSYSQPPDSKVNINYLVLPVLLKFSPIDRLSFLFGPECSYRLTAKATSDGNTTDMKSVYDSKIDFGVNAGLAYKLMDKVELRLMYNRGFISTVSNLKFTDEFGNDKGNASLYNQGFAISLTYRIKK